MAKREQIVMAWLLHQSSHKTECVVGEFVGVDEQTSVTMSSSCYTDSKCGSVWVPSRPHPLGDHIPSDLSVIVSDDTLDKILSDADDGPFSSTTTSSCDLMSDTMSDGQQASSVSPSSVPVPFVSHDEASICNMDSDVTYSMHAPLCANAATDTCFLHKKIGKKIKKFSRQLHKICTSCSSVNTC